MSRHEMLLTTMMLQALMCMAAAPVGALLGWHWDDMSRRRRWIIAIATGVIGTSPMLFQWACLLAGRTLWPLA